MPALAEKPKKVARVAPNAPWPMVQLGSLLREPLRNGHSAKSTGTAYGVRTLTLTAVTRGDFSEKNTKITSANPDRISDLWLEAGDILIERSNAPELVGTTRLYRGPSNFAIFPDLIIRVRLNPTADPAYIELVLQSEALRTYFKKRAKGMSGSMPKIDQQTISEAPIPLPPLPEQRHIVAEIEQQFTRLDAGVAALRRTQANLKRYRAAVLKAACEGRLVPTEAELQKPESRGQKPAYETGEQLLARILTQRRKNWTERGKYKEPTSPEALAGVALPEGWTWATMPQLGELNRGKSKHRPRDDARLYNGPHPFIQTGDIRRSGGTIREHSQTYSDLGLEQSRLWPTGTLCITVAANIAETGILTFPSCFPDSVVGFCHDGRRETTRYVEFFIRTAKDELERFAPATAQKNINLEVLQNVAIPLPPLAEQIRIVAEVERRLSVIDELESVVKASLQRATRLRQSVLQKAFKGSD